MVRIEEKILSPGYREVCGCDRCGVKAETTPGKMRMANGQVVEGDRAKLGGWGAVFVHQEEAGVGGPVPLGYLCPVCVAMVIPLFKGRA